MSRVGQWVAALLFVLVIPVCAEAQQSASMTPSEPQLRMAPATISKTELASRFQNIKTQYAKLKAAADKFVPLKGDAADELRAARSKINAAMRSYELYQGQTQKQRDKLNLLTDLSEMDSTRLQMAMDRLAKMSAAISNLMNQINQTGDGLVMSMR